jgi:lipopolysaccharide heptosyltransferase II
MRIVFFHLNQLGDLLFSLPALKSVRDAQPDAELVSVVRPGLAGLLKCAGLVDDVLLRQGGVNVGKLNLAGQLRRMGSDLAISFSQSAECSLLCRATGAPKRVGFVGTTFGGHLTQQVEFHHPPSAENNFRLISACGFPVTTTSYVGMISPSLEQQSAANELLRSHGVSETDEVIALAPGSSARRVLKRWSSEGFAAVGMSMVAAGRKVVIIQGEPADEITSLADGLIDLGGRTNLVELMAVLARCRAVVTIDSGVMHLAAAVGTPVVALFGVSDAAISGPQGEGHEIVTLNLSCSPCQKQSCDKARACMVGIMPERVITAVEAVLARMR